MLRAITTNAKLSIYSLSQRASCRRWLPALTRTASLWLRFWRHDFPERSLEVLPTLVNVVLTRRVDEALKLLLWRQGRAFALWHDALVLAFVAHVKSLAWAMLIAQPSTVEADGLTPDLAVVGA